jgi:hypothetical protein
MSKLGAVFLGVSLLAATPLAATAAPAADVPHHIGKGTAWGCRDKGELIHLLFLGLSTSFDSQLATALADGRCTSFTLGETVTILEDAGQGLVKVQRGSEPSAYWLPVRNVE